MGVCMCACMHVCGKITRAAMNTTFWYLDGYLNERIMNDFFNTKYIMNFPIAVTD